MANVKDPVGLSIQETRQGQNMGLSQVIDMDVIPDSSAIGRRIISAVNIYVLPLSELRCHYYGYQVSLRVMVFPYAAAGFGPCCVEIA
jgi:hypothetical protein